MQQINWKKVKTSTGKVEKGTTFSKQKVQICVY